MKLKVRWQAAFETVIVVDDDTPKEYWDELAGDVKIDASSMNEYVDDSFKVLSVEKDDDN